MTSGAKGREEEEERRTKAKQYFVSSYKGFQLSKDTVNPIYRLLIHKFQERVRSE